MHSFSVVSVAFLTSIVSAAGTVYLIERYEVLPPRTESVLVPQLRGLAEDDARKNAAAAGLTLLIAAREATSSAKAGTVIQQSIGAGQSVPPDHPVSVTLAEELPRLPNVAGLSLSQATERLDQAGYKLQVGQAIADDVVAEGRVASQAPPAEAAHAKNALVTVRLSAGPLSIFVPKLLGLPLNTAKGELEKAGLNVGTVRWMSIAESASNVVLTQKPIAGEKLAKGGEVELSINR